MVTEDLAQNLNGKVFLSSKTNSFIHSIADGIIIFNDELGSYGNMLIIDHGEEYHESLWQYW